MSLCAYIEIQFAAPAPDAAALKRSVKVMILFVMWPPPLQPIFTMRSRIGDAARDQVVDAGHHVEVRVLEVVADHVAQERVAVAGAAAVVRLQHRRSPCRRAPAMSLPQRPKLNLSDGLRPAVRHAPTSG